jgi:hypothetical protein
MRRSTALALAILATVVTSRAQPQVPINSDPPWHIAERFDSRHLVIYLRAGDWHQRDVQSWGPKLTSPVGDHTSYIDISTTRAREVVNGAAAIGDRWLINDNASGWFHGQVERFVMGDIECSEGWGVMVAVAPEEASTFAARRESHFVVRPDRGTPPESGATPVQRVPLMLSSSQQTQLRALLERARLDTRPEVLKFVSTFQTEQRDRWQALDQAIRRGESVLDFDFEAFRLLPDGDSRAFVRAEWKVGGQPAYVVGAWIRVGSVLTTEHADAARSRIFAYLLLEDHVKFGREVAGKILNIADVDGDGRGEVLMLDWGGDGNSVNLYSYAPGGVLTILSSLGGAC